MPPVTVDALGPNSCVYVQYFPCPFSLLSYHVYLCTYELASPSDLILHYKLYYKQFRFRHRQSTGRPSFTIYTVSDPLGENALARATKMLGVTEAEEDDTNGVPSSYFISWDSATGSAWSIQRLAE